MYLRLAPLISSLLLAQEVELERAALQYLRVGDLKSAHQVLVSLEQRHPQRARLRQRIEQLESLIARHEASRARMESEPLRYAHAYIKVGRLREGLQFLRAAWAKDASNDRLKQLVQLVESRLEPELYPNPPKRQPLDLLRELLHRVRQRRRSPSRWMLNLETE